jgi:hypothetical protein
VVIQARKRVHLEDRFLCNPRRQLATLLIHIVQLLREHLGFGFVLGEQKAHGSRRVRQSAGAPAWSLTTST